MLGLPRPEPITLHATTQRTKILYVEGGPRPEPKFILRAVERDSTLQVVLLQRTADGKYLRMNVEGPDELRNGFPATREELFA